MKQCPKCNFSCEDEDVICKNCGFLFLPNEFKAQNPEVKPDEISQNQSPAAPAALSQDEKAEPATRVNGMAIASLVLGIIGVVFVCCYGVGAVFGVIALVFGIISFRQIKISRAKNGGMSIAGIILGIVAIVAGVLIVVFIISNRGMFAEELKRSMDMMQKSNAG